MADTPLSTFSKLLSDCSAKTLRLLIARAAIDNKQHLTSFLSALEINIGSLSTLPTESEEYLSEKVIQITSKVSNMDEDTLGYACMQVCVQQPSVLQWFLAQRHFGQATAQLQQSSDQHNEVMAAATLFSIAPSLLASKSSTTQQKRTRSASNSDNDSEGAKKSASAKRRKQSKPPSKTSDKEDSDESEAATQRKALKRQASSEDDDESSSDDDSDNDVVECLGIRLEGFEQLGEIKYVPLMEAKKIFRCGERTRIYHIWRHAYKRFGTKPPRITFQTNLLPKFAKEYGKKSRFGNPFKKTGPLFPLKTLISYLHHVKSEGSSSKYRFDFKLEEAKKIMSLKCKIDGDGDVSSYEIVDN